MFKEFLLLVVLVIQITNISSGCLFNDDEDNPSNFIWNISIAYNIDIVSNDSEYFTIYIPAFTNSSESLLPINDNIILIDGNASIEQINTVFGVAVKIISNSSLSLELNQSYTTKIGLTKSGAYDLWYLSLLNHEQGSYWIFYNYTLNGAKEIVLTFNYTLEYYYNRGHGYENYSFSTILDKTGWSDIKGEYQGWVS